MHTTFRKRETIKNFNRREEEETKFGVRENPKKREGQKT